MRNQFDIREWLIVCLLYSPFTYSDSLLPSATPRVSLMKKAGSRPRPMSMKLKTIRALMLAF